MCILFSKRKLETSRVGITTLWLMQAMVSVLSCRVQSNSF